LPIAYRHFTKGRDGAYLVGNRHEHNIECNSGQAPVLFERDFIRDRDSHLFYLSRTITVWNSGNQHPFFSLSPSIHKFGDEFTHSGLSAEWVL
jgi:hypothetical protein